MEKEVKEVKKKQERWMVSDVPTETAPMVVNTESNEAYTIPASLAKILNNQEKLLKLLD